jgi:hypothetical protein
MKTSFYFSILSSLALTTTVSLAQAQEQASNTISKPSSLLRTTNQNGANAAAQSRNAISETSSTLTQSRNLKGANSKAQKELVPSPGLLWGYQYLQNSDFGISDPSRYNIDLSLEVVNPATTAAFVSARKRWMEIITGDVLDINVPSTLEDSGKVESDVDACDNMLPEVIDDVHICGKEIEIDGEGGDSGNILGFFSINLARIPATYPDNRFAYQTIAGNIQFDTFDANKLIKKGLWDELLLRVMGFVIGYGLLVPSGVIKSVCYFGCTISPYNGTNGNEIWSEDWGCLTETPPLVSDFTPTNFWFPTAFWDASCLANELMAVHSGPFFPDQDSPSPKAKISKLTIAAFEDLGFEVDYDAADDYDGSDTTCCSTPPTTATTTANVTALASDHENPSLSDKAREYATSHGLELLRKRNNNRSNQQNIEGGQQVKEMVTVMIEENGHIYNVAVSSE